jgi:hypothetical protein
VDGFLGECEYSQFGLSWFGSAEASNIFVGLRLERLDYVMSAFDTGRNLLSRKLIFPFLVLIFVRG